MLRELWWSFVTDVNRGLIVVLDTLENLGTRGWLWIVVGLWLLTLYVWIRDLPGAIRFLYFLVLFVYFVVFPVWVMGGI
jgi:hypothetical protein